MPVKTTKRSPRKIVRAVMKEPWCIRPEKLDQIVELLEVRSSGHIFSEEEIRDRIQDSEDRERASQVSDGIQVIDVYGTLAPRLDIMTRISGGTSLASIRQQINEAAVNDKVKTVILRVESPGGTYVGTPEVRDAIEALKQKKRVVASAENEFASGAYWIGSTAHEVYASPSTYVGSVGVYSVHRNDREAIEKTGTKFTVFKAGRLKASLHPNVEWSKDEIENQQARINEIYDQFIDAVSANRSVGRQEAIDRFGEGSTVFAEEAKARGMIDGVATFEEVLARERDRLSSSSSSVTFVSEKENETMKVTAKIKAALFSRGLISSFDVSDEICVAAATAFASGLNGAITDETSEEDVLAILRRDTNQLIAEPVESTLESTSADDVVEFDFDRIRAMARSFPHVTDAMALEAISELSKNEVTMEDIIDRWTENAADKEQDVAISSGEAQIDKFNRGAAASILLSAGDGFGHLISEDDRAMAQSLMNHDTNRIIEKWMVQSGNISNRDIDSMSREEIAEEFVSVGEGRKHRLPDLVSGGTVNYSGDHPHLVDQLANKVLWQPYPMAAYKYEQWCARLPDVTDFKPKHFVEAGVFRGMDVFTEEDNETRELKFESGKKAWYQVDRFRNKAGLTVEMVVNDQVGGFLRQLQSMADLPRKTLNRMCIALLNSNPLLWDGTALFDASRGNLVAAGGAPTSTQANEHFKLHQLMKGFDGEEMDIPPTKSLHPVSQREAAMQTFMRAKYDNKVANTDSNINTVRDEISPIIDARLDAYSTTAWYTFIDPALSPVIGYAFMKGYGTGGKREVRYDSESTKRFYYLESRFCSTAVDYRGMVKNPGA